MLLMYQTLHMVEHELLCLVRISALVNNFQLRKRLYATNESNSLYGSNILSIKSYGVTTLRSPLTTSAKMFADVVSGDLKVVTPYEFMLQMLEPYAEFNNVVA